MLGGGGITGAAFNFGTLLSLEMATGWDPNDADVLVGTSSGAFVGAMVRGDQLNLEAFTGTGRSGSEIEDYLGLDSLAYLEHQRLIDSTGTPASGFCSACLTGEYPVPIPAEIGREVLGERSDEHGGAFVAAPLPGESS